MKIIKLISRLLGCFAAIVMGLMMLLTVVDVFMRYVMNSPITGATELSELMMVVVVFSSLSWITVEKSQIRVDLLVLKWKPKTRYIIEIITLILTLATFVIITWRSLLETMQVHDSTSLLQMPEAPFHWMMTVGFAVLCLAIVTLIAENITNLAEGEKS